MPNTTNSFRIDLEHVFGQQAAFADGYSPLYAQLFATVAGWLAAGSPDPVVEWLLEAASGREAFDVTLLLAAALHREVLAGRPGVAGLARHYPTAGERGRAGEREEGGKGEGRPTGTPSPFPPFSPSSFPDALRETILARRDSLAAFIQRANVQTNETGRGLAWLLPVACLGWPAVHLVELGASAGLNLVADQRAYRLVDAADPSRELLRLGDGPPQFTTLVRDAADIPPPACCPTILSRTGGDMLPFHLRTADDELTLSSFVWADQPQRVRRLHEGIAALRRVESTAAPVRLRPLLLPDELPAFLADDTPVDDGAPLVIFNTVMTMYVADRGASMGSNIGEWAARRRGPVLWLQWEPPWGRSGPPEREWMAWTADYWPGAGGAPRHFPLAWVQPHGTALEFASGWPEFLSITMQN